MIKIHILRKYIWHTESRVRYPDSQVPANIANSEHWEFDMFRAKKNPAQEILEPDNQK
jgi:hypothetical protein